jgi:hypothetical protein
MKRFYVAFSNKYFNEFTNVNLIDMAGDMPGKYLKCLNVDIET